MNTAIIPFNDMQAMAEVMAKSKLFGMTDANSVLALMAIAQAEGLHPATAARDYHIIQGRPALKADTMLARVQPAGGKVEWKDYTDEKVTGLFTHPNGGSLELSWTLDQAKAIGLVKPSSGWIKYPRAMLRSRVVSEGIRSVYPGCVIGTYTPEEIQDFDPPEERSMGKAEVVVELSKSGTEALIAMKNDIPGFYQIYLPDGTVYANDESQENWIASYVAVISKIRGSEKYTPDQKAEKIALFREANDETRKSLSAINIAKLAQLNAQSKGI